MISSPPLSPPPTTGAAQSQPAFPQQAQSPPRPASSSGSSSLSSREDEVGKRANRWTGPTSTWLKLTEIDRETAGSLDRVRDRELGVHLWNAWALKRDGMREMEERKNQREEFDKQQKWQPPQNWTAWPLPADEVPREAEHIGPPAGDEPYTLRRRDVERPSRELEGVLTGLAVGMAKTRFRGREEEDEDAEDASRGQKRSLAMKTSQALEILPRLDGNGIVGNGDKGSAGEKTAVLKPVVAADDERSRELLRPSVRHTLGMLDEVLIALHHARNACLKYTHISEPDSDEEMRSRSRSRSKNARLPIEAEQEPNGSMLPRRVGRPRKHVTLPQPGEKTDEDEFSDSRRKEPVKRGRGRPKKKYPRLEGETKQEYLVRIAQQQKKALPAFAPAPEVPQGSRSRSRSRTNRKQTWRPEHERAERKLKDLRPRDWSEVLGSAALVGIPQEVLERTGRRCATLFGQGMVVRMLSEGPGAQDRAQTWGVDKIPELGSEYDVETLCETQESADNEERPMPASGRFQCEIHDCPRRGMSFKSRATLRTHFRKVHKLSQSETTELLSQIPEPKSEKEDSDIDGAVHVDGFLQPVTGQAVGAGERRKRGMDQKQRKKRGRPKSGEKKRKRKGQEVEESEADSDA